MTVKTFDINVPYRKAGLPEADVSPKLKAFLIDVSYEIGKKNRPAVIVCPGGGYDFVSEREADPIAMRFAAYGVHAFVLQYSVVGKLFPTALLELAQSVAYVRANAENWDIDPNKIAVCGFSAGGHLAASLGVYWNNDILKKPLGFTDQHKPNAMILSYPVITSEKKYRHNGSIRNLVGGVKTTQSILDQISLEKQVNRDTPRTFIWHCADDNCVPVENTICFISALSKNKISFESHIYPSGGHGLSLCDDTTASNPHHLNKTCSGWFDLALDWLKRG